MSLELIPLLTTVGTSLGVSWLAKGESGPLETLNSLWYLAFGNLNEITADKRYEALINRENRYLKDSVEKIAVELGKIPENCIQEPRENIVKPSLEALKTYNSEDELRDMFAKLIASSMDSRMNSLAHPSFVEMIKQLSPADAQNLKIIHKTNSPIPIAKFDFVSEDNSSINKLSEIFIDNPDIQDQTIQSSSITNLDRLGLTKIDYTQWLADEKRYTKFESIPEFLIMKQEIEAIKISDNSFSETFKENNEMLKKTENLLKNVPEKLEELPELYKKYESILEKFEEIKAKSNSNSERFHKSKRLKEVKVVPGTIKISSLGNSFCTICLS